MTRRSIRREADGEAPRLTAADRDTLWLLARLPLLWAGALAQLAGHAGPASTYRRLHRLRADGLVATVRPPQGAGSAPRLYYPTERGLAAAAAGLPPAALARQLRVTESDIAARLPGLPPLLAAYRLLAALAASRPGRPVLQEWEQPWRWRYPSPTGKTPLRVELPAYAEIRWDGGPAESCLLVPDLGVTPLRVYRAALSRLLVLRGTSGLELPLVIAVPSERRAEAWTRFLIELAQPRCEAPLTARIATWDDLAGGPAGSGTRTPCRSGRIARPADRSTGRPVG